MTMLQGTAVSDSPAVDAGRQKDGILPPISTHRKPAGGNDYGSTDEDSDWEARAPQYLSTRWRTKLKKSQNRLEANKSSMSDSFVLPRISGPSHSTGEHGDRKSRASLTFPVRTRETGVPLSKSCPALMSNPRRRRASREESPDYDYDGDFEESDSATRDVKSMSCHTETLKGRRREGKPGQTPREDITEGVVKKLAKLESPRGKAKHHAPARHHHEPNWHHAKARDSDTTLPDIFVPNGLSMKTAPGQWDRTPQSTQGGKEARQPHAHHHQASAKPCSTEKRTAPELRVPEFDDPAGEGNNNSYALDCSPWKAVEIGDVDETDPVDRQSHLSHSTKGRKKRKQRKGRPSDQERPNLPRDTSQADMKCRKWLADGHHQENVQNQVELPTQPNITS